MQVYDAIEKRDYDAAIKLSTVGKNDINNLENVIKQCEKNIKHLEFEFTREPVKHIEIEEKQLDDKQLDDNFEM